MPVVTCADCYELLDADPYGHSITHDLNSSLLGLCSGCALMRLQLARERDERDRQPAAGR